MAKKRLLQRLMEQGTWKRQQALDLIHSAKVRINTKIVTDAHYFVAKNAVVSVEDKPLNIPQKMYILLNKPQGYTCQKEQQANVMQLIPFTHVSPIGRLDKDTQGLLLLTNDGNFTNDVLSGSVEKEYALTLALALDEENRKRMEQGITIALESGPYKTRPCKIRVLRNGEVRIIITEGKKRQIRRMFESIGNRVLSLTRLRVGKLGLSNLAIGEHKILTKEQAMAALKKM